MRRRHYRRHRVHHRRRAHRGSSTLLSGRKGLWGLLGVAAPPIAFLDQLTSKNRSLYKGDLMSKAMTLANNITGNIFNFNFFSKAPKFKQQINPLGIANKYTGIGIASIIGSIVLPRLGLRIPMMSKAFSVGKKLLPAGILGGFFDDNGSTQGGSNYQDQSYYQSSPSRQVMSTVNA